MTGGHSCKERLTTQIADTINNILKARGVLVVIEAEHYVLYIKG
jgi:GTP cyclohydrolase I